MIRYINPFHSDRQSLSEFSRRSRIVSRPPVSNDYLTGIDEAAARMQQSSLFGEPDSFSYRNIRKTPSDFAHLKGIELNLSPSKGIELATDFPVTDGIAACILLLTILTLVMREKEQNQLLLYHTTFHGRGRLGLAKLCACFTIGIAAAVLLYVCNLLICGGIYGLGDLSRPIFNHYERNPQRQTDLLRGF